MKARRVSQLKSSELKHNQHQPRSVSLSPLNDRRMASTGKIVPAGTRRLTADGTISNDARNEDGLMPAIQKKVTDGDKGMQISTN